MLETLDYTIRIGGTPTFLYFDLYPYSAYAAQYICSNNISWVMDENGLFNFDWRVCLKVVKFPWDDV